MKKYNLENFTNGDIVINCDTEEKSEKFLEYLEKKTNICLKEINKYYFNPYKNNLCYSCEEGFLKFCNKLFFQDNGKQIVSFDEIKL